MFFSKDNYVDTYKWLVAGIEPSSGMYYPILSLEDYNEIHQLVRETVDASNGMLTVRAYNMSYTPISGATVSINSTSASGPHCFGEGVEHPYESDSSSSSYGIFRYLNVEPGDIEITVELDGVQCKANGFDSGPHVYEVKANAESYVRFLCGE